MEVGPGTEALAQQYVGEPFQALALDLWDGSQAQCELFADLAEITYPILMLAGAAGIGELYDCIQTSFFVIDGVGVIRYRNAYIPENWPNWHPDEVSAAIDEALADLTSVATPDVVAAVAWLALPYPNPANPRATVTLNMPRDADVVVDVLDLQGRRVRRLIGGPLPAGRHHLTWDGTDAAGRAVPSGTYLVWLRSGDREEGRFLSLVR